MRLSEFIASSLDEIITGVRTASLKHGAAVAPGRIEDDPIYTERLIHFDVSVTVSGGGGGSLNVLSVVELKGAAEREAAHRVSFDVPVHLNLRDDDA